MFGKRGPSGGGHTPPAQPASANAANPEFPNARKIGPNLYSIPGDGTAPANSGASDRIVSYLTESYRDQRGIQAETILRAAGALAGFAAQQAIWEGIVRPGKMTVKQAFVRIDTKSGEVYYFGDFINMIVASTKEGHHSIWRFVAGGALNLGAPTLPVLEPIFSHCAKLVGSPEFGTPLHLKHLQFRETARETLRHWPRIKTILVTAGRNPLHWPLDIAVAAQPIMAEAKSVLAPDVAALIVMEAAIPMSKVDPRTVPGGTFVE